MTNQVYGAGLTSSFDRFQEPDETEELYQHQEPCPFCEAIGGDGTLDWQSWSQPKYNPQEEAGQAVQCWECGQSFEIGYEMVEQEGKVLQWDGPHRGTYQPAPPLAVFKFKGEIRREVPALTDDQLDAYLEMLEGRANKKHMLTLNVVKADLKTFPFLAEKLKTLL